MTRTSDYAVEREQSPERAVSAPGPSSPAHRTNGRRRRGRLGVGIVAALTLVGTSHLPTATASAAVPSLREQAEKSGILIGSGSINPNYLDEPAFAATLAKQFTSLSAENELKWSWIEPQRDVFNFAPIDKLVKFAKKHDMVVKGHGFVSGGFNPDWLTQITDRDEL